MTRLVPDAPHPVVRRGWRRGTPVVLLHLVAMAVVHAVLLPATGRPGEAGDLALQHWKAATVAAAAGSALVFAAACLRIEPGSNRWVAPPHRSGWLPVPDPATGCLPTSLAVVAFALTTLVEVLAATGPRDALLLAGFSLLLQLAGLVVVLGAVLWVVAPGIGIVAGLRRRAPADGDGGPTGPLLITSGVAAYAGLLLAVTLAARLVGPPAPWWSAVALAVVLVTTIGLRAGLSSRSRPPTRGGR